MGGFFIFLAKTIAKKTIQMDFFKNIFAKKWAFSGSMAEKKFFLWRRAWSRGVGVRGLLRGACGWTRWTAARRGVGVRGVLARRSGRVWMDAMEVVHV